MTELDLFGQEGTKARVGTRRSQDHERVERDLYQTREPWVTKALMKQVTLRGPIWECASGEQFMAKVLASQRPKIDVLCSDIFDYQVGDEAWVQLDFLKTTSFMRRCA